MKDIFKREDFLSWFNILGIPESEDIANRANQILKEYAEKNWPLVYGRQLEGGVWAFSTAKGVKTATQDTHVARLAFIEEIKQSDSDESYYKLKHEDLRSKLDEALRAGFLLVQELNKARGELSRLNKAIDELQSKVKGQIK